MKYNIPRGTKDILPDESPLWQRIESTAQSIFKRFNFKEIRTPIFEVTELFSRSIGDNTDIVEKEMYTFLDKKERSLTLRPEGTAPITRAYLQNGLHKTAPISKLYYIGPMFRYERPQAGRYRQFHQIGVENLGSEHPFADAEVINLGIHIFDELGLKDLSVQINTVGCSVCRPVIEERLKQFIQNNLNSLCTDCQTRFDNKPLRILDCKNKKCQTYFAGLPDIRKSICQECSDHFNQVLECLDALNISFTINPRLVRGLDYYSRTTFEIVSNQLGAQNAICGGGRYDGLVSQLGGSHTPAVGLAFGIERAVMILQSLETAATADDHIQVYLAPCDLDRRVRGFYVLNELRRAGIRCEMDYVRDSLKAQLKQANKLGAEYVVIFNDDTTKRQCTLKNMKTSKQGVFTFSKLKKHLQGVYTC